MVLASEQYDNATTALVSSYWLKVGTNAFILTLLADFTIGLVLISLVTRNLRKIIATFEQFEQGDLSARIPEQAMKGELADLSHTFNNMADTILKNIDELKKVDSLWRKLIANVSYDLRSPLAVIHGYIETMIMKEDKLSSKEQQKYLQIILDSSDRLTNLVSDLFELSKLEARQIQLKKEPFFINELVLDAAQQYNTLADKKRIQIKSDISITRPMVRADISLMNRVIQNLLSNAIQYTPEKGNISLNVNQKEASLK